MQTYHRNIARRHFPTLRYRRRHALQRGRRGIQTAETGYACKARDDLHAARSQTQTADVAL